MLWIGRLSVSLLWDAGEAIDHCWDVVMAGLLQDNNGIASSEVHMQFSCKTVWDHMCCVLARWRLLMLVALAVFGALWTIVEASAYFLNIDLRGWLLYTLAGVAALGSALVRAIYAYLHECPDGLEGESAIARRIAQVQRPHWEFRLGRQLLEDKLHALDAELRDVLSRRVFVGVGRRLSIGDYFSWAQTRPDNLLRMVDVAKHLLLVDFPSVLTAQEGRPAEPAAILSVVNRIQDLYAVTVTYEREMHAIAPPDEFRALHALQAGWTNPIRDGMQQMFHFLDAVLSLGPMGSHEVDFTIKFDAPPNIDAFCHELDRLTRNLPG